MSLNPLTVGFIRPAGIDFCGATRPGDFRMLDRSRRRVARSRLRASPDSVVPSEPRSPQTHILGKDFGPVNDVSLLVVVRAWKDLPEHLKQAILR